MTKNEFLHLPIKEQVQLLFTNGEEVLCKSFNNFVIKLYLFYDFYVEIRYNSDKNTIEKLLTMDFIQVLEKYEDLIDISEIKKI